MPERRGLVIGCGGTLGFAWSAAALQAVERALGWDARTADVLVGTSAGSEMVALLGSGTSTDDAVSGLAGESVEPVLADHLARHPGRVPPMPRPGLPARGLIAARLRGDVDSTAALAGLLPRGRGDARWLRDFGDRLATPGGWVSHPATWLVAADIATGERVAFGGPDAPKASLGEAMAASWAIPGWFPPVSIAGRSFADGGTVSTASADLVAPLGLDELVVLAPMASHVPAPGKGLSRAERLLRRRMTRGLDRELEQLRAAGTRVVRIEPGPDDLVETGPNFMDLRRRSAVLATAVRTSPGRVRAALTEGARA